ncbi:MAG: glycosyltransferase family 4 protein, partial [Kiritimatiellia bacterium]
IDWLIREFAAAAAHNPSLHLVIAGSRQSETDALIQMAKQLCPHKITFAVNHPHASMPDLLRTLDAFVLPSLFEMMPIAILEAISTGLPVFAHQHPVLAWMVGPGGCCIDMGTQGTLAAAMQHESGHTLASLGKQAREHAQQTFATGTVIPGYIDYYQKVLQKP